MRPESIETKRDFARALTDQKSVAGHSIREIAGKADVSAATVGGWFSGIAGGVSSGGHEVAFRVI